MGLAESRLSRILSWRMMGSPAGLSPIAPVSRLSSNIVRILGHNPGPMTLQGTNTYLLGTGNERILIDTGEKGNAKYLESLQTVLAEEKARISQIILTHHHSDHTGGIAGVVALARTTDRPRLRKFRWRDDAQNLEFDYLHDGDKVSVEGATVKAVHTPGHTEDSISLLLEENNAVFGGDCILGEGSSVFEHYTSYIKSLHVLLHMKPNVLYPAHGAVIEKPQEAIQKYIDHRTQREHEILAALKTSYPNESSVDDLVAKIYPTLNFILRRGAANNVAHHLQKLQDEGRVEQSGKEKYKLVEPLT